MTTNNTLKLPILNQKANTNAPPAPTTRASVHEQRRPSIARSEAELFDEERPRNFTMWKKGQIANPRWLQRDNGSDFITIKNEQDLNDLEKYLARVDDRLAAEYYNTFSTGHDKATPPNRIIGLYDQDETGDNKKTAFICIVQKSLAMRVVEIVEQYCGDEI